MSSGSSAAGYDYVVVGSGAGGGTVAARLAEIGYTVLVLEAGGDPMADAGPAENRRDYLVPAFHPFATENPSMTWDYFVRQYASDDLERRNPRYVSEHDGVLYPRGAALGGSTVHNAMITVYPHAEDWDEIAAMTGDPSWSASRMRACFERLEDCRYRPIWRLLARLGLRGPRHGFGGWLPTEVASPKVLLEDLELKALIASAIVEGSARPRGGWLGRLRQALVGRGDPNDWRVADSEGLSILPLATRNHARVGSRERLLDVARRFPARLTLELDALATKVLLDDRGRAIGVEYLKGARLFRAHRTASDEPGERRQATASREVILAGGAFNTPQLLMLSGIGSRDQLERHGIPVRIDLPGVGRNLQDRYEVGVIYRMNFDRWQALEGAEFTSGDPLHELWEERRDGFYTSNGVVVALVRRSAPERRSPDLVCYGMLGAHRGYYPGWARAAVQSPYLTWVVRKAHGASSAGVVGLRSADPRDPPEVNFHYFDEGNDAQGEDLEAIVEGIGLVRRLMSPLSRRGLIAEEEAPGQSVESRAELRDFARSNAWGHDASCSCPIGDPAAGGVVNGDFEVHGARGLRIVDASVFPRTPGLFLATAVYMIGEKAAEVISKAAGSS